MPSYDASVSIASAREPVWRVLATVTDWPTWLPTVSSVEALDGQQLALGARYRIIQPKLPPATWTVTNLEPPRRFAWESRSPGILVVADHIIEDASPGKSKVVLRISFSGWLSAPAGWFARSITESYLAQEAVALKLKVEGSKHARPVLLAA
jgi:uncharacterized membrane protein